MDPPTVVGIADEHEAPDAVAPAADPARAPNVPGGAGAGRRMSRPTPPTRAGATIAERLDRRRPEHPARRLEAVVAALRERASTRGTRRAAPAVADVRVELRRVRGRLADHRALIREPARRCRG